MEVPEPSECGWGGLTLCFATHEAAPRTAEGQRILVVDFCYVDSVTLRPLRRRAGAELVNGLFPSGKTPLTRVIGTGNLDGKLGTAISVVLAAQMLIPLRLMCLDRPEIEPT